jgi:hypothetical protein
VSLADVFAAATPKAAPAAGLASAALPAMHEAEANGAGLRRLRELQVAPGWQRRG